VVATLGGKVVVLQQYSGWCCLVLSSAKIGRSSWRYYQRTVAGGACEYYTEHGDRPGRWHGQGLGALGLTPGGVVAERELEAMFGRALSPTTGRALGQAWRVDAVTGYDLTFSAPKSVSALWALGDPTTVEAVATAHTAAVHAALGYLDAHASVSRRGKDGVDQIGSAGLAAALFDHRTSRTGDPQLHTHALVINKVRCADGGWRTLDGHEIYHHKKAAGAIYQTALRAELAARLPVRFGPVSEHGQAEIAGIPDDLIAAWSTRTAAVMGDAVPTIADAEAALGRPVSAGERARIIKTAVLTTRPVKETEVPEGDLRARWANQATGLGWDGPRLRSVLRTEREASDRRSLPVNPGWADQVANGAVSAVGRSKAIWSRADLTVQVAARIPTNPGAPMSADGVVDLVEQLTDTALAGTAHGAVALGADQSGVTARVSDDRYASAELVDTEARILERVITGGFNTPSRVPAHAVGWFFDGESAALSDEQRRAAVKLVAAKDLVTVMTAPAGAGKTTTLAAAVRVWWRTNTEVIMLAPSARAAAELATATGAPGHTVARWLLTQQHLDDQPPGRPTPGDIGRLGHRSVVVVDEASMLTTTDLDQLTARVARAGASLVLVGDPGQIGAVNAPGGMFEHLTHVLGPRTVELTELHRFTHPWEAAATLRLRDGDPSVLAEYANHGRIHPETTNQDAADGVFDRWHTASDAGLDALMLARSWTDVTELNARARAVAIATGTVTGPDLATVTSRTASTRGHAEQRSWRAGDVLIAKKNTTRIPIGDDTVRNGDRYRVIAAEAGENAGLVVEDLRGRGTTTLPTSYLARHSEYGWAATIDGAQGATADLGIVLARSGLDREHLYVAMSRGREANHVHTTPELNTGDAGPHRPTQAGLQPPAPPAQASVQAPGRGEHPAATRRRAEAAGQLALPDLDAAITQLTTAVTTAGRERAAHTLLDPPVAQARERDWQRRDNQRPERPVPAKHLQSQRDLDRARTRLEQARDHVGRLDAQVLDLQNQLDDAPRWARGRRQTLTRSLTFTTETVLPSATNELDQASTDVGALAHIVDADSRQLLDDATADRVRRRTAWVDQTERPYTDPNAVPASTDRAEAPPAHRGGYGRDPHRTEAPPQGPHRSI
jgi:conjugative relaxase-like TrwC/TraI family protein